jgi:hypothetical protein
MWLSVSVDIREWMIPAIDELGNFDLDKKNEIHIRNPNTIAGKSILK